MVGEAFETWVWRDKRFHSLSHTLGCEHTEEACNLPLWLFFLLPLFPILTFWVAECIFKCSQIYIYIYISAKSLQLCPTLCDPIDGSPPGSPTPGTLQARTLEWVAISFSNAWKWKVKVKSLSRVLLLATPWTAAQQAPLSMGCSRQEYWSGVPSPSPSDTQSDYKIRIA